ncbi:hypothetical protein LSH36_359g00068 [Paralvinella palmiformis]|uniref:Uncharacterized protein n=1 Tax=Paralvinella palmiformis TaxID=53620 RepID=A0AAD9JE70_9ANNE|nr:hypothetical protein LSH36_359g00068 [Paralvinella palmiformis]
MLGVVVESEAGWPLYPYDLGRGDSVITVGDNERNTFQLVFPNDGTRSITVFNYGLMTALSDTKFAGEEIESFPYYYLIKTGRQEHLAIAKKRFQWRTTRSPTCQ